MIKMKQFQNTRLRRYLSYAPETLLLLGGAIFFLGDLIGTSSVNLFMLFATLTMLALLISRNKYLAFSIAIILGCVSIFFALALLSEFSEFPAGSREGLQMLLTGGFIFGSLLAISVVMPRKYFKRSF